MIAALRGDISLFSDVEAGRRVPSTDLDEVADAPPRRRYHTNKDLPPNP
jgi:hypothetical protein